MILGLFHANVNLKNGEFKSFLTVCYVPELSLLLAAIGAKLIGPHGDLQVDKQKVCQDEIGKASFT